LKSANNQFYSDTHKPEDNQLIVHCTILANPEPDIKWYVNKVPLHLCSLPRITVFNHPDDVHEHTVASLVILGPSFLDNGEYVIEVQNEAGFEKRVLNLHFQTEEEYNALYYQRYLEHKEHFKLHEYAPGEERWEDVVPEVKEFVFWEPEPETGVKQTADGKVRKRRKKHRYIKKKVMTAWGDEVEQDVTDEDASSESYTASEDEKEEEEEDEEEEEGWGAVSEPEDEAVEEPAAEVAPEEGAAAEEPPKEEEQAPAEEPPKEEEQAPAEEPPKEEEQVPTEEPPKEEEQAPAEEPQVEEAEALPPPPPPETEDQRRERLALEAVENFEDVIAYEDEFSPNSICKRRDDPEFPMVYRKPKFYITDFQLRKKFFFVNKLIDVDLEKGKTLRIESITSSLGPVTVEWRFNGRLISSTVRRTIEFFPRKNFTAVEIENTRVQDSGTYQVTFYNNYTEPLMDFCKVNIFVPQPKEVMHQPPTFTRVLTGINHFRLYKFK
jgi:Immunoglobulin I-set domain